jgi:hypothetical protein
MRPLPRFSEDARQLVHMATGVLNFLNIAIASAAAVLIAKSVA